MDCAYPFLLVASGRIRIPEIAMISWLWLVPCAIISYIIGWHNGDFSRLEKDERTLDRILKSIDKR